MAELVPVLDAPDVDFGRWEAGPEVDGQTGLGWFELGPAGEAVRAAIAEGGWVVAFDWRSWLESEEGSMFRRRPESVDGATPEQLARLLTAIVRSDRFVEGSMAGAFESGLLVRIARRAAALLEDGAGRPSPPPNRPS